MNPTPSHRDRTAESLPGRGLLLALLLAAAPGARAGDILRIANATICGFRIGLGLPGRNARCEMTYLSGLKVERSFRKDATDWWWVPQGTTVRLAIAARPPYRTRGRIAFLNETGMDLDQVRFALSRGGDPHLAGRVTGDPTGRVTLEQDADGLVMTIREAAP
jgi:hypothetical protein